MAAYDCSWSDLLGRTVIFRDLRALRSFEQITPHADYPPEYLNGIVSGYVDGMSIYMPIGEAMQFSFEVEGTFYLFDEVEILSASDREF
jgi:hypothetical protein